MAGACGGGIGRVVQCGKLVLSWRASSGLRFWLLQRFTAVYIVFFLVVFAVLWGGQPTSFETWRTWVAHPAANIALLLFVFSLLVHGWIGGRDVIMDYVKSVGMRYVLMIGFGLSLLITGLWALRILLLVGSSME